MIDALPASRSAADMARVPPIIGGEDTAAATERRAVPIRHLARGSQIILIGALIHRRRSRLAHRNPAAAHRLHRRLGARLDAQLLEDVAQVDLDRVRADRSGRARSAGWSCPTQPASSPRFRARSAGQDHSCQRISESNANRRITIGTIRLVHPFTRSPVRHSVTPTSPAVSRTGFGSSGCCGRTRTP